MGRLGLFVVLLIAGCSANTDGSAPPIDAETLSEYLGTMVLAIGALGAAAFGIVDGS